MSDMFWFCEEHISLGYNVESTVMCEHGYELSLYDDCRMVKRRLVSPADGVEINWCVPHARGAYLFDGVIQCESRIFFPCRGVVATVFPSASSAEAVK